jgi:hypothetical protein
MTDSGPAQRGEDLPGAGGWLCSRLKFREPTSCLFQPSPPLFQPSPPPCASCGTMTVIAPAFKEGQRIFAIRCPACGRSATYSLSNGKVVWAGAEACARDLGRKREWDGWARKCSDLEYVSIAKVEIELGKVYCDRYSQ